MELREAIILVVGFVVVAAVLVVLLRMVLSGQSNTAIERLKRINQENLQRELELKKKLDEAEAQYQKRISEASGEIQKMREKMEEDISLIKNKAVSVAEHEKDGILADARQEAQDLKNRLTASMNERIAEFSGGLIAKIFSDSTDGDKITAGVHQYFIDEAVKKIKSLKKEMLASALAGAQEIEISSRLVLTHQQKQSLAEAFAGVSSKTTKVTEKQPDRKYLAGISIKIGNLVIDATLNSRMKEILAGMTIKEIPPETK